MLGSRSTSGGGRVLSTAFFRSSWQISEGHDGHGLARDELISWQQEMPYMRNEGASNNTQGIPER